MTHTYSAGNGTYDDYNNYKKLRQLQQLRSYGTYYSYDSWACRRKAEGNKQLARKVPRPSQS